MGLQKLQRGIPCLTKVGVWKFTHVDDERSLLSKIQCCKLDESRFTSFLSYILITKSHLIISFQNPQLLTSLS